MQTCATLIALFAFLNSMFSTMNKEDMEVIVKRKFASLGSQSRLEQAIN
jgi:hypothetical protein